MKKILIFLLSLSLLGGCAPAKKIHLSEHVTLSFFYIQSCSQCQAFKSVAIPLLEDTYQDQITILQYDLDEPETEAIYDQIIDSLVDFDEEFYGNGPFIVLNGYFALLGYTTGDEEYLVTDIQRAVNHEELGYELEGLRFTFKENQ